MSIEKQIKTALISVYHKDNLSPVVKKLHELGITIYSTGGTHRFIEGLGIPVHAVEELTSYPSILGGRVKTLHPKIFGGILARREQEDHQEQLKQYDIPEIDLVIVDLYPFEATVASGAKEEDIIEQIDIGGISLIRAAAKNYRDVLIVPSEKYYPEVEALLREKRGKTDIHDRKKFASYAFDVSSHYDTAIYNHFDPEGPTIKVSYSSKKVLRYGENPHQKGEFYGNINDILEQLNGKDLSYNNLLDIDAAINLMHDFPDTHPTFAILKHNNTCGMAIRHSVKEAYLDALAGDPVSAFGGILISNKPIDLPAAEEMHKLFFEVLIAPAYEAVSLELLKEKKNRILLKSKSFLLPTKTFRSLLNGVISQERDHVVDVHTDFRLVTDIKPTPAELTDFEFAVKLVKHTKSNAIVLAKNNQLLASGTGQTSRVDALEQAIHKAKHFGFSLEGAVMASDAFFPFPDCVEIAHKAGIKAVVQPGGSIKDEDSINYCNQNGMSMVFTGTRHFKH